MELNIGEIIKLDDGKEYIIINKYQDDEIIYVLIMSNSKPITLVLTKIQLIVDICQLFPINDVTEIKNILNNM